MEGGHRLSGQPTNRETTHNTVTIQSLTVLLAFHVQACLTLIISSKIVRVLAMSCVS